MENIFVEYPKCLTCRSAKKWLDENNVTYIDRHIVEETPTYEELKKWITRSKKNIKSLIKYLEMILKFQIFKILQKNKLIIFRAQVHLEWSNFIV